MVKLILKNTLFVVVGLVVGSMVNMLFVYLGYAVFPPPADLMSQDQETMKLLIQDLGPQFFIFPLLAHAFGVLVGAWIVAKYAASQQLVLAILIGAAFLMGGIKMSFEIPAPLWFLILDLGFAYIPMALLGYKAAQKNRSLEASM